MKYLVRAVHKEATPIRLKDFLSLDARMPLVIPKSIRKVIDLGEHCQLRFKSNGTGRFYLPLHVLAPNSTNQLKFRPVDLHCASLTLAEHRDCTRFEFPGTLLSRFFCCELDYSGWVSLRKIVGGDNAHATTLKAGHYTQGEFERKY